MTSSLPIELPTETAENPPAEPLLAAVDLTVGFPVAGEIVLAANQVALGVSAGRVLGLVGESGCGKSVTLRALLGMVPSPGDILEGQVLWKGRDLVAGGQTAFREIRGREVAMVFQDPSAALNPVYTVGSQIEEVCRVKAGLRRREARARVVELLDSVGIPAPAVRARDYPHQLSGGMKQRVMIAMALACEPQVLLADEPTTALDVTIQDQILSLLVGLQQRTGMAMVLVSHDLSVISETCDDIAVMYAGHVVETGSRTEVIDSPQHPYTQALLSTALVFEPTMRRARLGTIAGQPPDLRDLPVGCPFQPRCAHALSECEAVTMKLEPAGAKHRSACPVRGVNR